MVFILWLQNSFNFFDIMYIWNIKVSWMFMLNISYVTTNSRKSCFCLFLV